jgi:chemotaxis family two-component system response regulator Rcp1
MFRILLVDDNPIEASFLQELIKTFQRPCRLDWVKDGSEALELLRGAAFHTRPNLILLDMNMPRFNGLETLSAVKADRELRVIPVIMLSTSAAPDDVRKSYQAHANCYVQKPTDLEQSVRLIRAIEAFWMEFAVRPLAETDDYNSASR